MINNPAKHNLLAHENCTVVGCAICTGAVQVCLTCNGSNTEAGGNSLTTHCYEKALTEEQKNAIANKDLDFKGFRWHDHRLGPTIKETLDAKKMPLSVGTIVNSLIQKEGAYICVGVYENSIGQTVYAFHQVMTLGNRADAGFLSIIHYKMFQERFGEI